MLAETADGVAVRRYQHPLAAFDGGDDLVLPRRQETVFRELGIAREGEVNARKFSACLN